MPSPKILLPPEPVTPGNRYTLQCDSKVQGGGSTPTAQMVVEWWSTTKLSENVGPAQTINANVWTPVATSGSVQAPAGSTEMRPHLLGNLPVDARWQATQAIYLLTGSGSVGSGTPDDAANLSDNPKLASAATSWGMLQGGTGSRQAATGHVSAGFEWRVAVTGASPWIFCPSEPATADQTFNISVDMKSSAGSSQGQIVCQFFNGASFLGEVVGSLQAINDTDWTKVTFNGVTCPANTTEIRTLPRGNFNSGTWRLTQHIIKLV